MGKLKAMDLETIRKKMESGEATSGEIAAYIEHKETVAAERAAREVRLEFAESELQARIDASNAARDESMARLKLLELDALERLERLERREDGE